MEKVSGVQSLEDGTHATILTVEHRRIAFLRIIVAMVNLGKYIAVGITKPWQLRAKDQYN